MIELLAVLTIFGLLLGLLFPAFAAARRHVALQALRLDWMQWEAAVQEYQREYGRAPDLTDPDGAINPAAFLGTLAALDAHGAPVPSGASLPANPRRVAFLRPRPGNFVAGPSGPVFVDAFGNARMGCVLDADGDGWVTAAEVRCPVLVPGNPVDGVGPSVSTAGGLLVSRVPPGGIRASAGFFCVEEGGRLVTSWD
jgi:type II secretory pathway pseudopilin PulG